MERSQAETAEWRASDFQTTMEETRRLLGVRHGDKWGNGHCRSRRTIRTSVLERVDEVGNGAREAFAGGIARGEGAVKDANHVRGGDSQGGWAGVAGVSPGTRSGEWVGWMGRLRL